jgi:hypothetical protein
MIHIILDQSFTDKKFNDFVFKQKWELLGVFEADPDKGQAGQIVCSDPLTKCRCYYVEDYLIDLRYLILEGKKEKDLEEAIFKMKGIKLLAQEKIFTLVSKAKNRKDLVLGLRMLAVISPKSFEENFFNHFLLGLQHKDPFVRHASLKIVTYPSWKEFNPIAKAMSENDPDPVVRETAEGFLKAYEQIHGKKKKKAAGKSKK